MIMVVVMVVMMNVLFHLFIPPENSAGDFCIDAAVHADREDFCFRFTEAGHALPGRPVLIPAQLFR